MRITSKGLVRVSQKIPLIHDCDPGIDDALTILLALASPEVDVRALTVVAGNLGLMVRAPVDAVRRAEQDERQLLAYVLGSEHGRVEPDAVAHGDHRLGLDVPADLGGWPHGRVWMSTASADVRMRAASQLARAGDLSTIEDSGADHRIDAVGYLIGVGAWSDRTVAALKPLTRQPVQLVAAAVNTPEYLTS